jgi:hypothetical protein
MKYIKKYNEDINWEWNDEEQEKYSIVKYISKDYTLDDSYYIIQETFDNYVYLYDKNIYYLPEFLKPLNKDEKNDIIKYNVNINIYLGKDNILYHKFKDDFDNKNNWFIIPYNILKQYLNI